MFEHVLDCSDSTKRTNANIDKLSCDFFMQFLGVHKHSIKMLKIIPWYEWILSIRFIPIEGYYKKIFCFILD